MTFHEGEGMAKRADSDDEQVTQWWLERHPEPRDIRWADLTHIQRVQLTAWYAIADVNLPAPTESLPLEYLTALSELLKAAGRPPERGFMRHRIQPGMAPNHRRRVRARKRHGQLA